MTKKNSITLKRERVQYEQQVVKERAAKLKEARLKVRRLPTRHWCVCVLWKPQTASAIDSRRAIRC